MIYVVVISLGFLRQYLKNGSRWYQEKCKHVHGRTSLPNYAPQPLTPPLTIIYLLSLPQCNVLSTQHYHTTPHSLNLSCKVNKLHCKFPRSNTFSTLHYNNTPQLNSDESIVIKEKLMSLNTTEAIRTRQIVYKHRDPRTKVCNDPEKESKNEGSFNARLNCRSWLWNQTHFFRWGSYFKCVVYHATHEGTKPLVNIRVIVNNGN